MAFTTYAELQAEIVEWMARTDLTARIPGFIRLAEAEYNRMLIVPEREIVASATAAAETLALPSDFSAMRAIYIIADPKVVLEQMSLAELRLTYSAAATGQPQNFAIQGGDTLVFGPSPDASYSVILNYYQDIPALSDAATSNWLLVAHPDLYLYGALTMAEAFMANDKRIGVWKELKATALVQIEQAGRRAANSASPQRIRAPQVV